MACILPSTVLPRRRAAIPCAGVQLTDQARRLLRDVAVVWRGSWAVLCMLCLRGVLEAHSQF